MLITLITRVQGRFAYPGTNLGSLRLSRLLKMRRDDRMTVISQRKNMMTSRVCWLSNLKMVKSGILVLLETCLNKFRQKFLLLNIALFRSVGARRYLTFTGTVRYWKPHDPWNRECSTCLAKHLSTHDGLYFPTPLLALRGEGLYGRFLPRGSVYLV